MAFIALGVLAFPPPTHADDPLVIVYRADTRSPADVRASGGFIARGIRLQQPAQPLDPDLSLFNHARGIPEDAHPSYTGSGYVGTFSTLAAARRWLANQNTGTGYIYEIRATQNFVDVEGSLGEYAPHPRDGEVAAMSYIRMDQVLGWEQYIAGLGMGFESNPTYDQRYERMRGAGVQPQLAGFPANHEAWRREPWRSYTSCQSSSKRSADECSPLLTNLEAGRDFMIDYRDEVPQVAPVQIQAAALASGRVRSLWWLTRGDRILQFRSDDGAVISDRPIAEEWSALKGTSYARGIDAMVNSPDRTGEYWLFRNNTVVTYADYSDAVSDPKTIAEAFPALADSPIRRGIDAVVSTANTYELMFLRGSEYAVYNTATAKIVDSGGLEQYWPALKQFPNMRIDALLEGPTPGQYRLFAGDHIIDYDDRKETPMTSVRPIRDLEELRPWLIDWSLEAESCTAPSRRAAGTAPMPKLNLQVGTARSYGLFIDAIRGAVAGNRIYKDIRSLPGTRKAVPVRLVTKSGQIDVVVSDEDLRIVGWYNPTQNTFYALAGRKTEYFPNYYTRPYWLQLDSDPRELEAAAGTELVSAQVSRSSIFNAAETLRKATSPNTNPKPIARALLVLTHAITGATQFTHIEDHIEAAWHTGPGLQQRREFVALENRWEELSAWVHAKLRSPETQDVSFPSTALAPVDSLHAAENYLRIIRTNCD